jgi:hypothetical protein
VRTLEAQTYRLELAVTETNLMAAEKKNAPPLRGSIGLSIGGQGGGDAEAEGQEMVENMLGWMVSFLGGRRKK